MRTTTIVLVVSLLHAFLFSSDLGAEQYGLFTYEVNGEEITITDYPTEEVGEVTIPATINGKRVTRIGNQAFDLCFDLTGITIPRTIETIGWGAFRYCGNLSRITIPDSVTSIEDWAFANCVGLTEIEIEEYLSPRLGVIGYGAFADCNNLSRINLPDSITTISGEAFRNTNLTDITLPSNINSIEFGIFQDCYELKHVSIPPNVANIADWSFSKCYKLRHIELPSNITSIGDYAFSYCSDLADITIPQNVATIGTSTFFYCSSLAFALFEGDAPSLGSQVFDASGAEFAIYYYSENSGFSLPTWQGYPSVEIDRNIYPAASWLLVHGLAYNTDLNQDLNGDGIELLMAYALNEDPRMNLAARTPEVTYSPETMSMTF